MTGNIFDNYWIVAGDETLAWSSATGGYVSDFPIEQATRILNEEELSDVLRKHGLTLPRPTSADYASAIQAHIDATARSRGYNDPAMLASYVASTVPAWALEAQTFVAWRDAVWVYAYGELAKVQAGIRPQPTVDEIVSELAPIVWP